MLLRITVATGLAAACITPAALAHVTMNPREAPADSFFRFAVRVPNERDNPTTKITVRMPAGLTFVSFQPKTGWKRTVRMQKLSKPLKIFGETITERVATVTWSGGTILPGEFDEFGLSAHLPNAPGRQLVFPALQTYASGEIVRWIGPPDADTPASRVTLTAADESSGTTTAPAEDEETDGDDGRASVALGLGGAGLVAGLAALGLSLWRGPRRP
jgi:uncharacterized protein YcnI